MKNEPAFPITDERFVAAEGLTKREYFAAMAMQALLAGFDTQSLADKHIKSHLEQYAHDAVVAADALLAALEVPQQ